MAFDILIENPIQLENENVKTIGQMLFEPLTGRDENCNIILSHIENEYIEISLYRLRLITRNLISEFKEKHILKGQTVVLLTFQGCNEMITALYFVALASFGCRVFMPMYSETIEFSNWIEMSRAKHIIFPEGEVMSLDGHEREKSAIREIEKIALETGVNTWDNLSDFGLRELFRRTESNLFNYKPSDTKGLYTVNPNDEALIVTTSGTSGRSRLVVYTHKSYYYNCLSWEQAGFYKPGLLGGIGFTPLFTHTMGIRAFVNALWTGVPVCLIITEWFLEKPEIVRYFLLNMKPEHITGGPAVYNAFIELFRIYPELKTGLSAHFKTLVSSGAKYNAVTANEIHDVTGMQLHNAFGTTETQQVLSTLLSSPDVFKEPLIPLGRPLPGVSIGLMRTGASNQYNLFVKSIFGHAYCLSEEDQAKEDFYDTGDTVLLDKKENLFYIGRISQDYFKDSFGVKIPVSSINDYYGELFREILHAEFYPVINFPGISALLFINETSIQAGLVTDKRIRKKYAGIVEGINNRLMHSLETMEFQHRHVCRIALINKALPHTGKGSISIKEISVMWHDLIERLTDTRKDSAGIEVTEKSYRITDKYTRYISPLIGSMLTALKIDVSYHRGLKDSLFTYIHGKETEVLDMVGGYGTNLTGHNHPLLCKAAMDYISSGKVSICNQVSIQQTTGQLAEKLNLMIGAVTGRSYQIMFANSGSEAVEIALHHAFFEWKRRLERYRDQQIQVYGDEKALSVAYIWKSNFEIIDKATVRVVALSHAFHGHSTGARSILGNEKKRSFFRALSNIEPLFLNDRDESWYDNLEKFNRESVLTLHKIVKDRGIVEKVPYQISTIIASIAEPVVGEGGAYEVNKELLKQLASFEFPLISDEIQCGFGRSGNIPEYKYAHYYLFGKALGGGLEKISAVLIDSTHYCERFSEYYVSTFGNGELAAHLALNTLQVIETEKLDQRCAEAGIYLHRSLCAIQDKFPSVIQSVGGKGLLQAIYFDPSCAEGSILLRILFQTEKAGYLFSAWFLNRHNIRVLPTLSAPHTLRIEPSAYLNKSETDRFCKALYELCQIIRDKRSYDLFSFLMDNDPFQEGKEAGTALNHYNPYFEEPVEGAVKTAFIAHFVIPVKELRMLEPDLQRASDTGLRIFFKRIQILMEMRPVQIMAAHLFNKKVHFSFYVIPLDSAELEFLHKSGRRRSVVTKIQEAVDLASANGASVISLGGYTSILTNNGLSLAEPPRSRIITGNTLTAASGLMHLRNMIRQRPEFNKPNTIAIIGSTGNIGSIITQILFEQKDICKELILISRSVKREIELIDGLKKNSLQDVKIRSTTNLSETRNADVIIICTNTNDPIVFPHHIARNKPVLISDLSVPTAVTAEVKLMSNVVMLPFAAYVSLPEDKETIISSYSPPGTVFCCAGEAILMALESCEEPLKGKIMPGAVKAITRLAIKHGLFQTIDSIDSYKTLTS